MLTDLTLAMCKGGAGILTGSSALVVDAVHSAGDLLLSGTVLFSTQLAAAPPDANHPYGHGRFDTLGALAVSGLLMVAGGSMALRAFESVQHMLSGGGGAQPLLAFASDAADLGGDAGTAALALGACIASVGVKEALYRWTLAVGVAQRSAALVANAAHHRADSLSTLVAAAGVAGAALGAPVLDPLAALLISAMVGKLGVDVGLAAAKELVEERLDDALLAEVTALAAARSGDILALTRLRARRSGPSVLLDCQIEVRPGIAVSAAAAVAEELRAAVYAARPEVIEAIIVTAPHTHARSSAPAHSSKAASQLPSAATHEDVRKVALAALAAVRGVRTVTACSVHIQHAAPAGRAGEAAPPEAVTVRARLLCDGAAPLREASEVARRARLRLLQLAGEGEAPLWRVVEATVELETAPL